jgi:hypothetical protein
LRAEAGNAGFEVAQDQQSTTVRGELLIGVTNDADEELFRQELRKCAIEMEVDAVLVLCVRILEIVGEAANRREFLAGPRADIITDFSGR